MIEMKPIILWNVSIFYFLHIYDNFPSHLDLSKDVDLNMLFKHFFYFILDIFILNIGYI